MVLYYVLAFLLYRLGKIVYNLYFHPLHKFPGPKLTAATHAYEFYYSIVKDGQFIWEIEKMHKQYGPIVRINPRELHISDPSFYNEIYAGNPKKVDGDLPFTRSTGVSKSMFAANEHNLHQFRRNILANFFSKRSITNIQPLIQDKIERLIKKLEEARNDGSVVNLTTLSAAFTADTISHYTYGVSLGCLDGQSENILTDATQAVLSFGHWLRFIPLRFSNMKKLHPRFVESTFPKAATVLKTHRRISALALEVLNAKEPKSSKETMFTALADPELPAEERTLARLEDEGFVVLAAGTETTAYSLSVTLYHLLANPDIQSQLYDEVKNVMPEPSSQPPLAVLENLPLLRGVVNEGLRLSMGTFTRHPRVAPDRVLQYKDWTIPVGTPCSTATYFVHTNPEIFPNPTTFDPWRWIRAAEQGQHLESQLALFSKGSRACLGIK
ncbi:MAG: hypothetical protein Q9157_001010 [Trypethelium eluteriae]